jgi:uncharacterized RDD family membrane protein YckC
MNAIEKYIENVMKNIHTSQAGRERMLADLRMHLEDAFGVNTPEKEIIERMGSPLEVAAGFMQQVKLTYATFWQRLAAFLVDMLIVITIAGFFAAFGMALSSRVPQHPTGLATLSGGLLILVIFGCSLAAVGTILAYFPLLEGRFGQTLGKRLLHLRVLTEECLPIGYKEAILRRLSFYFEILPVDALFIPFSEKKQRAFDTIARTIVVVD